MNRRRVADPRTAASLPTSTEAARAETGYLGDLFLKLTTSADGRFVQRASLGAERVTTMEGVVCTGRRRGRRLGFPTANLTASGALPEDGVYAGRVGIEDEPLHRPALVTVGTSPTFSDVDRRVEAHLLDFDADLYGSRLRIVFLTRLGPMRRFASADALATAIRHFAAQARAILSPDAKEEPTWS
jgi:riboflavin kinase/FMN adenylyltransferase